VSPPSVLLRGPGWKLPAPLDLNDPLEVREVSADRPGGLPGLLEWLDEVAESGRADRIAAGFLTYEAGVALEGSPGLFRPPSTPLAWFALFELGQDAPAGGRYRPTSRGPEGGAEDVPGDMGVPEWTTAVEEIRQGIARGDVYQANLTRRIVRESAIRPRRLADLLWQDNPVSFAICADLGGLAVVSNSPELFLDVDLVSRRVASTPIKGTIPRLLSGSEDTARAALLASEKDAAEHLMIVDLIRNDLGRVSAPGTVHVPTFRAVTTYRHLHHLESTVAGTLREDVRLSDVFLATLPGGSITGAPKRAALRFIRRLEPVARGPYTGAAGYVRGDGKAVFNVAIRTAVVRPGSIAYHAGGGIVWDSEPLAEWEESETKSREFFRALADVAGPSEVK
jgi:anthranilate/para-aminobenzoate synthase component I